MTLLSTAPLLRPALARADCYDVKARELVQQTVTKLQAAYGELPASVRRVRNAGGRIAVTLASLNRAIAEESGEPLSPAERDWIRDKEQRLKNAIAGTSVFQLVSVAPEQQEAINQVVKAVYRFNKNEITPRERVGRLEHIAQVQAIMFWHYAQAEDGRSVYIDLDTVFLDGHREFPARVTCRDQLAFGQQRTLLRFSKKRSELGVRAILSATDLSTRALDVDASIRGVEALGQIYFSDRSRYVLDLGFVMSHADTLSDLADFKEGMVRFLTDYKIARIFNLGAGIDLRYRFDINRPDPIFAGTEGVHIRMPLQTGLMAGRFHDLFVQADVMLIPRAFVATGEQQGDSSALDWGPRLEFGMRTPRLDVTGHVTRTSAVRLDDNDDDFERTSARVLVGIGSRTTKLQVGAIYDKTRFQPFAGQQFEEETRAIVLGFVHRHYGEREGFKRYVKRWLQ